MPTSERERFVGRVAERTRLTRALERARAGAGSIALVLAEAGGGKTRLVEEFVADGAASGAQVAWGRAVEDAAVAYWPWRQVFRRLEIPLWLPDVEVGTRAEERSGRLLEIAENAIAGLSRATAAAPIVVVLDDLQWADDASLHLLRLLVSELAEMRLLIVATARDAEPGTAFEATLGSIAGRPAVSVLRLPALSGSDVAEYLADHAGGREAADWVHRQSGGNPLYVRELSRLLAEGPVVQDAWTQSLPLEMRAVLSRRLAQLDAPVRAVVGAASVLGDEFDVRTLAAIHDGEVAEEVDAAVQRGVLVHDPDGPGRMRFSHGLVRSALYAELSSGARVRLHRRAADFLEREGAAGREEQVGELARHWARAASTPDERRMAVERLRLAADVARRRLAFDEAVRLLRSATATARLGPAGPEERAALEVERAAAEFSAGLVQQALESGWRAVHLAEEADRPDLAASGALVVSAVGDVQTLRQLLSIKEHALGLLPAAPSGLRVRLEAQVAGLRAELGSIEGAEAPTRAALAEAQRLGDPDAIVDAVRARHFVCSGPDGVAERLRLGSLMIDLGRDPDRAAAGLWGRLWRIDAALQLGNLPEAYAEVSELASVVERLGRPIGRWHLTLVRAGLAITAGRLDEAERLAHDARLLGQRLEDFSLVGVTYAVTGEVERLRARGTEVLGHLALAERFPHPVVKADLAQLAFALGDVGTARRLHEDIRPLLPGLAVDGRWFPTMGYFGATACDLGDEEGAGMAYAALAPFASYCLAGGAGAIVCQGSVSTVLGRLAALLGKVDDAHRHFAAGAAVNRRIGALPYLAGTLVYWADLLARSDPARARTVAEEGGAMAHRLGMDGIAAVSRDVLQRLRASPPAADPLTRREREVAALVAEGRSNREIAEHFVLSERTVETHVSRILTKLGLASRTQLAAWVLARH